MNEKIKRTPLLCIGLCFFWLSVEIRADVGAVIQESQKMTQIESGSVFVWWLSPEFWEVSFKESGELSEAQLEEFLDFFDNYTVFLLGKSTHDSEGNLSGASPAELRKSATLTVNGREYEPLLPVAVDEDSMAFYASLKPMMMGSMGEMGELMEIVLFPGEVDGKRLIDAKKEGAFHFSLFGRDYKWKLPLGSLLPPVFDPETGEEFPGSYKFNPFTGKKLGASRQLERDLGDPLGLLGFNERSPANVVGSNGEALREITEEKMLEIQWSAMRDFDSDSFLDSNGDRGRYGLGRISRNAGGRAPAGRPDTTEKVESVGNHESNPGRGSSI